MPYDLTAHPGEVTTLVAPGLPSGVEMGYQVMKAASGTISIGRTEVNVIERPANTGTWVVTFTAPPEGDVYLVILDWSAGMLTPDTSKTYEMLVTADVQAGSSGLGAVADYVRMYLGAETWGMLRDNPDYGEATLSLAIGIVKQRALTDPPATSDEGTLDPLVLSYLGLLGALELISAARDVWSRQVISKTTGDSPTESVTFPNRFDMVDRLRDELARRLRETEALAIPLLQGPRMLSADNGPSIDEDEDCRVLGDPRDFPSLGQYPYTRVGAVDPITGIRIGV